VVPRIKASLQFARGYFYAFFYKRKQTLAAEAKDTRSAATSKSCMGQVDTLYPLGQRN